MDPNTFPSVDSSLLGGDALITSRDVSRMIGYSIAWLSQDRQRAVPRIPFYRLGARNIRYRLSDIAEFLLSSRYPNTVDQTGGGDADGD